MADDHMRANEAPGAAPGPRARPAAEPLRAFAAAAQLHQQGKLELAAQGYAEVLRLHPRFAEAYNNFGVLLRRLGKGEAAVACYRRALALKPNNSSFHSNLGNVLRELGQHQAAAASHQRAVHLAPEAAEPVYNLGLVLRDLGHLREALACFNKAISKRPDYIDAHWDRSLTLLQMGDYEGGFREYEWRWHLPNNTNRLSMHQRWNATDLAGKTILLQQEQGLGDMIQFIRYARLVKESGAAAVIVECMAPLARLFSKAAGVDEVVLHGGDLPEFDYYVPMMSLAGLFGTRIDAIPGLAPYLSAPSVPAATVQAPPGTLLKIGIAWAGKPSHRNDRNRSCPLEQFVKLTALPGAAFYSLQKGPRSADLKTLACEPLIVDLSPGLEDFADTAAAMRRLDLVIAVDTAVVHLAGALGIPVWTLLPFAGDWRWLSGRDDSPWYPSMRLFRQDRPGEWGNLFERVGAALAQTLKELAAARGGGSGA